MDCGLTGVEAARAEGDRLPAAGPAHGAAAARPGHQHDVGRLRGAGHEPGTASRQARPSHE